MDGSGWGFRVLGLRIYVGFRVSGYTSLRHPFRPVMPSVRPSPDDLDISRLAGLECRDHYLPLEIRV